MTNDLRKNLEELKARHEAEIRALDRLEMKLVMQEIGVNILHFIAYLILFGVVANLVVWVCLGLVGV